MAAGGKKRLGYVAGRRARQNPFDSIRCGRSFRTVVGMLALWLAAGHLAPSPARAEIEVGMTAGVAIPGDQDIKFKQFSSTGTQLNLIEQKNVDPSLGPLFGGKVTAWGNNGFLQFLGLGFESFYWHVNAKPAPPPPAPAFEVGQHRMATFFNGLARVPLHPMFGRFSSKAKMDWFFFTGAGGGPVYTRIEHGTNEWGLGFQLLAGLSIPLFSHLRLRLEGRYLLAPDADTSPTPGWQVDTSGSPGSFRFGPHLDTSFIPVLLGIDWWF